MYLKSVFREASKVTQRITHGSHFLQNIIFTFWWKNNAVYFVMTFGCTHSMLSFSTRLTLQNKPNMLSNPRISFDFQRMKFLFLRGGHRRSRSRFTENETVISHSSSFTTFCVMEQNRISRQYYKNILLSLHGQ